MQGFQYYLVARRDVDRAAQRLLRAYEDTVDCGVELADDGLPFLEGYGSGHCEHRSVGKMLLYVSGIHLIGGNRCASNGDLSFCPAYHPAYVMDLTRVFITVISLDKMRDRAGFYQQLDLTHEPKPRVLLRIARTVVIKLAYTAELLYYHTVDLPFSQ